MALYHEVHVAKIPDQIHILPFKSLSQRLMVVDRHELNTLHDVNNTKVLTVLPKGEFVQLTQLT